MAQAVKTLMQTEYSACEVTRFNQGHGEPTVHAKHIRKIRKKKKIPMPLPGKKINNYPITPQGSIKRKPFNICSGAPTDIIRLSTAGVKRRTSKKLLTLLLEIQSLCLMLFTQIAIHQDSVL